MTYGACQIVNSSLHDLHRSLPLKRKDFASIGNNTLLTWTIALWLVNEEILMYNDSWLRCPHNVGSIIFPIKTKLPGFQSLFNCNLLEVKASDSERDEEHLIWDPQNHEDFLLNRAMKFHRPPGRLSEYLSTVDGGWPKKMSFPDWQQYFTQIFKEMMDQTPQWWSFEVRKGFDL